LPKPFKNPEGSPVIDSLFFGADGFSLKSFSFGSYSSSKFNLSIVLNI